jgi:hypothetical protein
MKKVYTTDSVAMAWHLRNVLEQHDIQAQVRNANLYSVAGELPVNECLPQIWVGPLDYRRAEQIIQALQLGSEEPGPDWQCQTCSELNTGTFEICWNCQAVDTETAG